MIFWMMMELNRLGIKKRIIPDQKRIFGFNICCPKYGVEGTGFGLHGDVFYLLLVQCILKFYVGNSLQNKGYYQIATAYRKSQIVEFSSFWTGTFLEHCQNHKYQKRH